MAENHSPEIIVNRRTEKIIDSKHLVKNRIEQIERTYYGDSNVPSQVRHQVISEDDQPLLVSSYKMSTALEGTTINNSSNSNTDSADPNNTTTKQSDSKENNTTTTNQQLDGSDSQTTNHNNNVDLPDNAQLISRTTQQVKTQQVKTITKVYTTREVRHMGPDGQPIDGTATSTTNTAAGQQISSVADNAANTTANNNNDNNNTTTNEYTNFPGPKVVTSTSSSAATGGEYPQQPPTSNDHTANNFDNFNNHPHFDPHYSNTNFQKILQQRQQHANNANALQAPSPSPGSGSTGTTGSTAAAPFAVNAVAASAIRYDPYSRNNQIGYQDYSNFNNFQDLTNGTAHHPATDSSPQPPIRRHHLGEMGTGGPGDDATYVQSSMPPPVYGYVQTSSGQMQIPLNAAPPQMHSQGAPAAAIYGNFEDAPQGYLDRRQTYDENTGGPATVTYGQMGAPRNIPLTAAMYEDAESAYQHLHALQQAGMMDPQQAAVFFQNGAVLTTSGTRMAPMPPTVGGAPGSSAVTAIGPDGVRWRDPDLHEVIEFLTHPNSIVRANAAAYLQHLCFMDDSMKAKTRALGGIPALINLLAQDVPEIQRNACGALRNLSYGRQNDENKRAIRNAAGIPALVRLLRKTPDNEIRELVTSVLWNLSSCEDLKRQIIDDALHVLVSTVIIPHSGWDRNSQQQQQQQQTHQQPIYWSTVFRNASGVVRNVSSAGEYARRRLRDCEGLVDSLLFLVRAAIGKNDMDNKSVENCVCILRNLSYRCQEVVDPEYDKHPPGVTSPTSSSTGPSSSSITPYSSSSGTTAAASPSSTLSPSSSSSSKNSSSSLMGGLSSKVGENISCFGGSKKKSKSHGHHNHNDSAMSPSVSVSGLESKTANLSLNNGQRGGEVARGMELLWQTDVVQPYLALLSECSNPETLEAAAGAIQNLAACYWQPSIDIRGAVRKEKGLPILVELLRMEVDRVVCAVATALRNLAMDTRNKELIGKYALKDLVSKLPAPSATGIPLETGTSDDTVAAVLATLNEVISRNPDFAKSMLEAGGMQRLTLITKHRNRFSSRVVKFTCQLLYNMWQHSELRDVYRKAGWKESHFIISHVANGPTGARQPQQSQSGRPLNGGAGPMTPSQSSMMIPPSTPTANGTLPGAGFYHSISANNTLSRPMSTVGGTKYEDHGQYRGTLTRNAAGPAHQMMAQRMHEEMLMSDMIDGSSPAMAANDQTMARAMFAGPLPGEPVYAQVNRERKRQQQQLNMHHRHASSPQPPPPSQPPPPIPSPVSAAANKSTNGTGPDHSPNNSQYHNVMIDPTNNEPIYPPSMPAGDSWV